MKEDGMIWYICKCGGEIENDDEQTKCPDCHRVGGFEKCEDQSE